jgi:hypothetical protein
MMQEEVPDPITLTGLLPLKKRHQVSLQFIIRRVFDLEMVTPNQYRYLNMQISTKGWKRAEPGDSAIVLEQPRMFAKMVHVVYGNPPDFSRMKRDMGGPPVSLLRTLVNSHNGGDPDPSRNSKLISFNKQAS